MNLVQVTEISVLHDFNVGVPKGDGLGPLHFYLFIIVYKCHYFFFLLVCNCHYAAFILFYFVFHLFFDSIMGRILIIYLLF